MEKVGVQKIICYITKGDKLLVFRHTDYTYEEVGIQVPAGSIREGENQEDAARREVTEETGLKDFESVTFLDTQEYDMTPYRSEIQERHFFHFKFIGDTPARWSTQELHDGKEAPTNLECFWIDLKTAHVLQSGQGAALYKIFKQQ